MSRPRWIRLTQALLLLASPGLQAAGRAGSYLLDWPHRGQVLRYHACGCADDCWVAEVSTLRPRVLRARLSCDCETLRFETPAKASRPVTLGSCEAINGQPDKALAIRATLERLLDPPTATPTAQPSP